MSTELKTHLLYPGLSFLLVAALFEYGPWDIAIADYLFHLEGGSWNLRRNLFTSSIMHKGGRSLVKVMVVCLLGMILYHSWKKQYMVRRAKIYLLTSIILITFFATGLKHLTHVSCPWELVRYGGDFQYFSLFSALPPDTPHGDCFPAGHASAGYAWVALYYYFSMISRKYRWHGLVFGLVLGLGFDIAQQLRGAHFISHGLWTVAIAWFVATSLYFTLFRKQLPDGPQSGRLPKLLTGSRVITRRLRQK